MSSFSSMTFICIHLFFLIDISYMREFISYWPTHVIWISNEESIRYFSILLFIFTKHHHHTFPITPPQHKSYNPYPYFPPLISKTSPFSFLKPSMSNSPSLPTYYIPMKPSTKRMDWHPTRSSNHYRLHFSLFTNYMQNHLTLPPSPESLPTRWIPSHKLQNQWKKSLPHYHVIKCAIRSIPLSLCQHGINIQTSLASTLATFHHFHLPPLTLIVFWHGSRRI